MRFLFLPPMIFLVVWMTLCINYSRGKQEKAEKAFWDREREANMTRRKSLDGLNYIHIPLDKLPLDTKTDDDVITDSIDTVKSLADDKVVNLTGYTNTDLKLMYGAPNINILTRYDQSYLTLARALQSWGNRLFETGYPAEARTVLEFAISTGTDIKGSYTILKKMYDEEGNTEGIETLISTAKALNSANRPAILRMLGVREDDIKPKRL